jgi:hypothetical protein
MNRRQGPTTPQQIPAWLTARVKQSITVHKLDGMTLSGVLEHADVDGVTLRAVVLREANNVSTPLAGEVWIPREQVSFAQLSG